MSEIFKTKGMIKSVKKDKKGFQLDDGKWYTGFKELNVSKGQHVQFDYTVNGDFRNIHNGSLAVDPNQPKDVSNEYKTKEEVPQEVWDAKERRTIRVQCLHAAIAWEDDTADVLKTAEEFENWVFR